MTHKDIYTKFMIEYDKANVTSSYPSLTEYEVATVLDKAYNALIAQKVTGNNVRRAPFEYDTKAISDIAPLITTENVSIAKLDENGNVYQASLPERFLYFVKGNLAWDKNIYGEKIEPMRGVDVSVMSVKLVNHDIATNFMLSSTNIPWVKDPVCYIEDGNVYVVCDPFKNIEDSNFGVTYIKKPNLFVKDLDSFKEKLGGAAWALDFISYFDYDVNKKKDQDDDEAYQTDLKKIAEELDSYYQFECNDTVAEELISLAVAFALENVESQRLNSKLNMRGLEA